MTFWVSNRMCASLREGRQLIHACRLVDEITYKRASEATDLATQSAILGPFFRANDPIREKGSTITFNTPKDAQVAYMYGTVVDAKTKKPLVGASVDVWEASTNGECYDQDAICVANISRSILAAR